MRLSSNDEELLMAARSKSRASGRSELTANVTLQQLMYYNVLASCVYFVLLSYATFFKIVELENMKLIQSILLPFSWFIWTVAELARSYFGFIGNLREHVPQLSAFLLLTLFPQAFVLGYLAFIQEFRFPFETPLTSILLVFALCEFTIGIFALLRLFDRKVAQFKRLAQDDDA